MNDAAAFLERYGQTEFRHSDELMAGLRSGAAVLKLHDGADALKMSCNDLHQVFCKWVMEKYPYEDDAAKSMFADVYALCDGLAKTPDRPAQLWTFFIAPDCHFWVYADDRGRIAGCLYRRLSRACPSVKPPKPYQKFLRRVKTLLAV